MKTKIYLFCLLSLLSLNIRAQWEDYNVKADELLGNPATNGKKWNAGDFSVEYDNVGKSISIKLLNKTNFKKNGTLVVGLYDKNDNFLSKKTINIVLNKDKELIINNNSELFNHLVNNIGYIRFVYSLDSGKSFDEKIPTAYIYIVNKSTYSDGLVLYELKKHNKESIYLDRALYDSNFREIIPYGQYYIHIHRYTYNGSFYHYICTENYSSPHYATLYDLKGNIIISDNYKCKDFSVGDGKYGMNIYGKIDKNNLITFDANGQYMMDGNLYFENPYILVKIDKDYYESRGYFYYYDLNLSLLDEKSYSNYGVPLKKYNPKINENVITFKHKKRISVPTSSSKFIFKNNNNLVSSVENDFKISYKGESEDSYDLLNLFTSSSMYHRRDSVKKVREKEIEDSIQKQKEASRELKNEKVINIAYENQNSTQTTVINDKDNSTQNAQAVTSVTTIRQPQPIQEWQDCPACHGYKKCSICGGLGVTGYGSASSVCNSCLGSKWCRYCNGLGGKYITVYK